MLSTAFRQDIRHHAMNTTMHAVKYARHNHQFAPIKVYQGPFAAVIKRLKRVSVFSCGSTLISVPLLAAVGNADMTLFQRSLVASTVVGFALLTTGSLHGVLKPYVTDMHIALDNATKEKVSDNSNNASDAAKDVAAEPSTNIESIKDNQSKENEKIEIEIDLNKVVLNINSLDLLGRTVTSSVKLEDLVASKDRAWANFKVLDRQSKDGKGYKYFYVHDEQDMIEGKGKLGESAWIDNGFKEEFLTKVLRKKEGKSHS